MKQTQWTWAYFSDGGIERAYAREPIEIPVELFIYDAGTGTQYKATELLEDGMVLYEEVD